MGGVWIPYTEGHRWLSQVHNVDLVKDHSEDISILFFLLGVIHKHGGHPNQVTFTQPLGTDPAALDCLIVT